MKILCVSVLNIFFGEMKNPLRPGDLTSHWPYYSLKFEGLFKADCLVLVFEVIPLPYIYKNPLS
jgi:hypothetical protein